MVQGAAVALRPSRGLALVSPPGPWPFNMAAGVTVTSSNTSRTAAPHGSSSGSIPPPGTIHWSGCRLLLTSNTCHTHRTHREFFQHRIPKAQFRVGYSGMVVPSVQSLNRSSDDPHYKTVRPLMLPVILTIVTTTGAITSIVNITNIYISSIYPCIQLFIFCYYHYSYVIHADPCSP